MTYLFLVMDDDHRAHQEYLADDAAVLAAVKRTAFYYPEGEDWLPEHIEEAEGIAAKLIEDGRMDFEGDPPFLLFQLPDGVGVRQKPRAVNAQAGGPGRIYVTCHQCDNCQHIGINDEHPTESACNRGICGWHGPTPSEDRCPGCGETGTMSTACPECGGHYVLLADADVVPAGVRVPLGGQTDAG